MLLEKVDPRGMQQWLRMQCTASYIQNNSETPPKNGTLQSQQIYEHKQNGFDRTYKLKKERERDPL